jgi:hypothetical protein
MPGIDQSRQFIPLKIAVLTVSDTRLWSGSRRLGTRLARAPS